MCVRTVMFVTSNLLLHVFHLTSVVTRVRGIIALMVFLHGASRSTANKLYFECDNKINKILLKCGLFGEYLCSIENCVWWEYNGPINLAPNPKFLIFYFIFIFLLHKMSGRFYRFVRFMITSQEHSGGGGVWSLSSPLLSFLLPLPPFPPFPSLPPLRSRPP